MNYHNKKFKVVNTVSNGEVDTDMVFHYTQKGNGLQCAYTGGNIIMGHLLGTVQANGIIDMRYHQLNVDGELQTGRCISTPEVLPDGRIRLHEKWEWTSGDRSKGTSTLEEVLPNC